MGSYTFRWEHPAEEVFVTGTFDDWGKTVKLDKSGSSHEKTVDLPKEKVLYKFVADGNWSHDHTFKTETDQQGFVNNVLYPDDIKSSSSSSSFFGLGGAAISSVAPGATTTSMAGSQPLEKSTSPPGAFPQTPGLDDQTFSVNPIPASSGAGNPVQLEPGEKVPDPSSINDNSVTSQVHDDPSLKSSAQDGEQAPGLSPNNDSAVTSQVHDDQPTTSGAQDGEQTFGVAPIPATGGAGNPVHLEPGEKVPDPSTLTGNTIDSNVRLDQESYERSDTGAPVLPPAISPMSEREASGEQAIFGGFGSQTGTSRIPESGGLPMAAAPPTETSDVGPTMSSVAPSSTTNELAGQQPIEPRGVPEVVSKSEQEAGLDPEAASNPEAVKEKQQVEDELLKKVPTEPSTSESGTFGKSEKGIAGMAAGGLAAAGAAAGLSSVAPNSTTNELAGQQPIEPLGVPEVVSKSEQQANVDPEATSNPEAVQEKQQVEDELLKKVPTEPSTSESGTFGKSEKGMAGMAAGGLAAAGAAAAGTAYAMRNTATEKTGTDPVSFLPQSVQNSINNMNNKGSSNQAPDESQVQNSLNNMNNKGSSNQVPAEAQAAQAASERAAHPAENQDPTLPQQTAAGQAISVPSEADATRDMTDSPPQEVITSQKEAGFGPEASGQPEMVHEKQEMEKEMLAKVHSREPIEEPTSTTADTTSAAIPSAIGATDKAGTTSSGAPQLSNPTAGVAPLTMDGDKSAEQPVEKASGLNATAEDPAVPPTQTAGGLSPPAEPEERMMDSRDVSPMSRVATAHHTPGEPTVTTGTESSKTPAKSEASKPVGSRPAVASSTPQKRGSFVDRLKGTPDSSKTSGSGSGKSEADSKKDKRRSFFGRIKDKLKPGPWTKMGGAWDALTASDAKSRLQRREDALRRGKSNF